MQQQARSSLLMPGKLSRHQPNQLQPVPFSNCLSPPWSCPHGPGCKRGLHTLSGLHGGPQTASWPQGETAHGLFLHELTHTLRADRWILCLDRLCFPTNRTLSFLSPFYYITPWSEGTASSCKQQPCYRHSLWGSRGSQRGMQLSHTCSTAMQSQCYPWSSPMNFPRSHLSQD